VPDSSPPLAAHVFQLLRALQPQAAKPAAKAGVSWLLLGEHAGVDLNVAKPAAKAGVNCRRRRGCRCLKVTGYRVLPTG